MSHSGIKHPAVPPGQIFSVRLLAALTGQTKLLSHPTAQAAETMADYDAAAATEALNASLTKIRHHTSSKLENQRAPALLLAAIETGIAEHHAAARAAGQAAPPESASPSPTEYLVGMLSMVPAATSNSVRCLDNIHWSFLTDFCLGCCLAARAAVPHRARRAPRAYKRAIQRDRPAPANSSRPS